MPVIAARMTLLAVVASLTVAGSGCTPGMARFAAGAFIMTAAVVTIAAIHHDAHYHSHHCGHHYVLVEDRPVYHYQGHWEYYDEETGQWYRYRQPPPEARQEYYIY